MTEHSHLRIDLSTGQVEVSGSEEFLLRLLPSLLELLNTYTPGGTEIDTPEEEASSATPETSLNPSSAVREAHDPVAKSDKAARRSRKLSIVQPIAINLKGGSGQPSLRDFLASKMPGAESASQQEIITVFTYYLVKTANLQSVKPGHLVACFNEVGLRKPTNLPAILNNIRQRKAWLQPSDDEKGTYVLTVSGENLVEHDLPHGN